MDSIPIGKKAHDFTRKHGVSDELCKGDGRRGAYYD
jgi:hypothetical protein